MVERSFHQWEGDIDVSEAGRRTGGVLHGINVIDLSDGVAGAITTMLLANHGANVTKIEPLAGDPTRGMSGATVWHRSKRSAAFDFSDPQATRSDQDARQPGRCRRRNLPPGRWRRFGLDGETLCSPKSATHPLLNHRLRQRQSTFAAARTTRRWWLPGRAWCGNSAGGPGEPSRASVAPLRSTPTSMCPTVASTAPTVTDRFSPTLRRRLWVRHTWPLRLFLRRSTRALSPAGVSRCRPRNCREFGSDVGRVAACPASRRARLRHLDIRLPRYAWNVRVRRRPVGLLLGAGTRVRSQRCGR